MTVLGGSRHDLRVVGRDSSGDGMHEEERLSSEATSCRWPLSARNTEMSSNPRLHTAIERSHRSNLLVPAVP